MEAVCQSTSRHLQAAPRIANQPSTANIITPTPQVQRLVWIILHCSTLKTLKLCSNLDQLIARGRHTATFIYHLFKHIEFKALWHFQAFGNFWRRPSESTSWIRSSCSPVEESPDEERRLLAEFDGERFNHGHAKNSSQKTHRRKQVKKFAVKYCVG